ncbi:hypothetical protein F5Y04DRAFT_76090 [Hypomontagnella monticulosa]|nr:hypothetical protein F5Y04DRAFT_76090 [Hypomontagnella monticulosa]
MHIPTAMLSLPPSLLLLLAAATQPRAQQHPREIRKMSPDEGEKFLPEYVAFGPAPASPQAQALLDGRGADALLTPNEELLLAGNSSAAIAFRPAYPLHYDYHHTGGEQARGGDGGRQEEEAGGSLQLYRRAREVLAKLQGRQFACPAGTHSCADIDQPNYCCSEGTTCFVVTNAPDSGNVGCCPDGQTCGVTVGECSGGATACPANVGGGCCIPGFVCAEVGCVSSTVSVITQTTVTSTTTPTQPPPTTQVITVIVTVTPPGGGEPVTSTTTQTTTASGPTSPSTSASPTNTGTDSGGIPPYRPTSGSTVSSPSSSISYCPTGFYPCVASAGGGCCQTGRDCATTSCPPPPPMTTIVSNGATIAVPVSDAEAAASSDATKTCASGWFLCGSDAGPVAGCCPSGYDCGTASCTLAASSATATVQKELPSSAPGAKGSVVMGTVVVVMAASLFALGLA